jgi:hypothetical protein
MSMITHAPALRALADRAGLPSVAEVAAEPGVTSVIRLTALYPDGITANRIATFIRSMIAPPSLAVVHLGLFGNRPIFHAPEVVRCTAFDAALRVAQFDSLEDQDDISQALTVPLWLLERAANAYTRAVLLAPTLVEPDTPHALLVEALRTYLPEAAREIRSGL